MKTIKLLLVLLWVGLLPAMASAGTTAISYQGRLTDNGAPANGTYDLRFTIYDATAAGNTVAGPVTNAATAVSAGVFIATLDFGAGIFTGADRWLEIAVRPNGSLAGFTVLTPRQPLAPVPYALFAQAGNPGPQGPPGPTGPAPPERRA